MNDRDKLNQLGKKWYNMPEQGNEAVQLALYEEIFGLADKLFPGQRDALRLFFEKDWSKFDPRKEGLYGFMNSQLSRRMIDLLGEKWYYMPEQGNEAARLALREKIFVLAYKLFPRQSDAMGSFFHEDWSKFDPGKGDLYGFMSFRLKMRMEDLDKQDHDGMWIKENDPVTGRTRRVKKRHDPLSTPTGEDDSTPLPIPGDPDVDDSKLLIDERVLELMTLMLNLKDRLGSRAGNPTKINYYRLFFTDGVVDAIHDQGTEAFARRERDLFRVIKEAFLNFFMCSPCSSVEEIFETGQKLHGQMVEGKPMEPPGHPLPGDVYTTYLEQVEEYPVGESAVSQQRTAYITFMKKQLQC